MHRAIGALVALSLLAGCAARSAGSARAPAAAPEPSACDAPRAPVADVLASLPGPEPATGQPITRLSFRGNRFVPESLLARTLRTRPGDTLEPARIAEDVRRLLELEAFENVSVEASDGRDGVSLVFVLREKRLVGRVDYRGLDPVPVGRHVPLARGELYDPARVFRAADRLEEHLRDSGYARAEIDTHQRENRDGSVSVCFRVRRGPRFLVSALSFPGAEHASERELTSQLHTDDGKANVPGTPYRPDLLDTDLLFLSALYYDRGFVEVKVGPPVAHYDAERGTVRVEVPIEEGAAYRVGTLTFAGKLPGTRRELLELLGVESGSMFNRTAFAQGLERIREHYRARGKNLDVEPESVLDPPHQRVNLTLQIRGLE